MRAIVASVWRTAANGEAASCEQQPMAQSVVGWLGPNQSQPSCDPQPRDWAGRRCDLLPVVFPSSPCFNRGCKYRLPDLILPQVSLPLCVKIRGGCSAVKKTKVTPSSTPSDLSVNVHDNNYLISIVFSSWCIFFVFYRCFAEFQSSWWCFQFLFFLIDFKLPTTVERENTLWDFNSL